LIQSSKIKKSILKDYFREISSECRNIEYKLHGEELALYSMPILSVDGLNIN